MSGDFEKSAPPNDIFRTIDQGPVGDLPKRITAVCSEHSDYVVHSITKVKQRNASGNSPTKKLLLHLRRDDGSLSKDVAELREKVDILVRMLSFIPDVAVRVRDAKNRRYEVPKDWDDDLRNLFGSK